MSLMNLFCQRGLLVRVEVDTTSRSQDMTWSFFPNESLSANSDRPANGMFLHAQN